ncbi:MAG: hypothetical protein ACM3SX_17340 [Deltaproteobacteria bacterium]
MKRHPRMWRRVRTLLLLDPGYTVTATAEAVGTYRREMTRIGKRYLAADVPLRPSSAICAKQRDDGRLARGGDRGRQRRPLCGASLANPC